MNSSSCQSGRLPQELVRLRRYGRVSELTGLNCADVTLGTGANCCCDSTKPKVFHLRSVKQRLVAHEVPFLTLLLWVISGLS